MECGLRQCGIETHSKADGLHIVGGSLHGGEVDSAGDHRVAMAFAVAGAAATDAIAVRPCEPIATSFPNFVELAGCVGFSLQTDKQS